MFRKIALHEPYLIGNEKKYLYQCIKDNWITWGKFVTKFENYISNYLNINYAVSCVNGTSSLHIALKALNIRAPKNSTSNHIRTSLCYLLAGEWKAKYTPIQRNGTKVAQKRHNAPLRIF